MRTGSEYGIGSHSPGTQVKGTGNLRMAFASSAAARTAAPFSDRDDDKDDEGDEAHDDDEVDDDEEVRS